MTSHESNISNNRKEKAKKEEKLKLYTSSTLPAKTKAAQQEQSQRVQQVVSKKTQKLLKREKKGQGQKSKEAHDNSKDRNSIQLLKQYCLQKNS